MSLPEAAARSAPATTRRRPRPDGPTGDRRPGLRAVPDAEPRRTTPTERTALRPLAVARPAPRRTVVIQGRGAPLPPPRRAGRSVQDRTAARPDRIALWAVVLGLFLVVMATTTADAATRLGDRPLKRGMVGRDVRHLQLRLSHAGFLDAPATARFGPLTRRAVVRYQRSRCLKADGIAGPATVRALRRRARPCRGGRHRGRTRGGGGGTQGDRRTYVRGPLGARTLARGTAGSDVRTLQRILGVRATGIFGPITARAVRRFQRQAGLAADGRVGPATKEALVDRRMAVRMATWYGPGLFGNRTACGQRLTRSLHGVAHRRLPCGTAVTLYYAGRFTTAKVVDRGPFRTRATFDLTAATARSLGLRTTTRVRAAY